MIWHYFVLKKFHKCFNVELFRSWISFAVLDEHLVRRGGGGAADGAPGDYVSRPEGNNDGLIKLYIAD